MGCKCNFATRILHPRYGTVSIGTILHRCLCNLLRSIVSFPTEFYNCSVTVILETVTLHNFRFVYGGHIEK